MTVFCNRYQHPNRAETGLYLAKPVFTHDQLYVALSRVRSVEGLKIVLGLDQEEEEGTTTTNVVYREVFSNVRSAS